MREEGERAKDARRPGLVQDVEADVARGGGDICGEIHYQPCTMEV